MKDKVGWTTQKAAHELRKLYGAQISHRLRALCRRATPRAQCDPSVTADYYADLCEVPKVVARES